MKITKNKKITVYLFLHIFSMAVKPIKFSSSGFSKIISIHLLVVRTFPYIKTSSKRRWFFLPSYDSFGFSLLCKQISYCPTDESSQLYCEVIYQQNIVVLNSIPKKYYNMVSSELVVISNIITLPNQFEWLNTPIQKALVPLVLGINFFGRKLMRIASFSMGTTSVVS